MKKKVLFSIILSSLLLVGATSFSLATSQSGYSLTTKDSRLIPAQTLTIEGQTFTVSSYTTADPGDQIAVKASVAQQGTYRIYLRNDEKQIVTQKRRTQDATVNFDLSGFEPGMYLLTIYQDGNTQAVHPLVVRRYAVQIDGPSTAEPRETAKFNISVEHLRGDTLSTVELALTDGDTTVEVEATRTSGTEKRGVYTANVDLDSLSTGTYQAIGVVRGDTQVYGEYVVFGGSPTHEIQVSQSTTTATQTTAQSTTTTSESTTSTTSSAENSAVTPSSTVSSPTTTAKSTESETRKTQISTTSTDAETSKPTTRETAETTVPTTDEKVITPGEQETATIAAGPGFTLGLSVLAMGILVLLFQRRS